MVLQEVPWLKAACLKDGGFSGDALTDNQQVSHMRPFVFLALGLVFLSAGLVGFFYPKLPPLGFTAFLGGHPRLYLSLISIVLGGVLALLGLWGS
jgi:hypothetical protein